MTKPSAVALIADLEDAVRTGSSERRVQMLRQMTDLFLSDADRLNEQQISVFDNVLVRLMDRIEERTLAQLSGQLADLNAAPKEVVRTLAYHEEASVAGPVLRNSSRLEQADLMEIASKRGQDHLLAISGRASLDEALTDVLIKRGDRRVSQTLAGNQGAQFSTSGYSTLVQRSEHDEELACGLGLRLDIPLDLLRQLLIKATQAVRDKLLAKAPPELRDKIQSAISAIAEQIGVEPVKVVDYTRAQSAVLALNRAGNLNDSAVNRFALEGEYDNVVAAMSLLASVKTDAIETVLRNPKPDGLIVACRASRLSWSTVTMIIRNRPGMPPVAHEDLEQGKQVFDMLSLSSAQRTMRFWSAQTSAKRSA